MEGRQRRCEALTQIRLDHPLSYHVRMRGRMRGRERDRVRVSRAALRTSCAVDGPRRLVRVRTDRSSVARSMSDVSNRRSSPLERPRTKGDRRVRIFLLWCLVVDLSLKGETRLSHQSTESFRRPMLAPDRPHVVFLCRVDLKVREGSRERGVVGGKGIGRGVGRRLKRRRVERSRRRSVAKAVVC